MHSYHADFDAFSTEFDNRSKSLKVKKMQEMMKTVVEILLGVKEGEMELQTAIKKGFTFSSEQFRKTVFIMVLNFNPLSVRVKKYTISWFSLLFLGFCKSL